MKNTLLFSVTFLFLCGILPSQVFTITSPKGGETWPMGMTQTIAFNLNQAEVGPIEVWLRKDNTFVGFIKFMGGITGFQPGPYSCSWQVLFVFDQYGNQIKVHPGSGYTISLSVSNGVIQCTSNPFTILPKIDLDMTYFNKLKQLLSIPVIWPPDPGGCPACGKLDLSQLRQILSGYPDPIEASLFFNGQLVSSLGRIGRGAELADSLQVRFTADAQAAIKRGGAQFELRIVNASGQTIHTQVVLLNQAR